MAEKITIRLPEAADIHAVLENTLTAKRIRMEHIKVSRLPGGMLEIVLDVLFPTVYNIDAVLALLKEVPEIESIDL